MKIEVFRGPVNECGRIPVGGKFTRLCCGDIVTVYSEVNKDFFIAEDAQHSLIATLKDSAMRQFEKKACVCESTLSDQEPLGLPKIKDVGDVSLVLNEKEKESENG